MLRNSIGAVVFIGLSAVNLPSKRLGGFIDKPLSARVSFVIIYTSKCARTIDHLRRIILIV